MASPEILMYFVLPPPMTNAEISAETRSPLTPAHSALVLLEPVGQQLLPVDAEAPERSAPRSCSPGVRGNPAVGVFRERQEKERRGLNGAHVQKNTTCDFTVMTSFQPSFSAF